MLKILMSSPPFRSLCFCPSIPNLTVSFSLSLSLSPSRTTLGLIDCPMLLLSYLSHHSIYRSGGNSPLFHCFNFDLLCC